MFLTDYPRSDQPSLSCIPLKVSVIAQFNNAGAVGDYADEGQHAAKHFCTVISFGRGTE